MLKIGQRLQVILLISTLAMILVTTTMCTSQNPQINTPITFVYLDGHTLIFECVGENECFQNYDLDQFAKFQGVSLHIGPVFSTSPSNIYVTFVENYSGFNTILNINPETKQIRSLDLPDLIEPYLALPVQDKMVFPNGQNGKLFILQKDQSFVEVDLEANITRLIEGDRANLYALSYSNDEDGNTFWAIFDINLETGLFTKSGLEGPSFDFLLEGETPQAGAKYGARLVSVSPDLKYLYYLYYLAENENKGDLTLGMFDAKELTEVHSTSDVRCLNLMVGYAQSQNVLYSSQLFLEGSEKATLVDMSTLQPIIDSNEMTKNEQDSRLTIVPFGEYFLLGMDSKVVVISPKGKIIDEYALPIEWTNRDYTLMEYSK
jgi:hypothetical protein